MQKKLTSNSIQWRRQKNASMNHSFELWLDWTWNGLNANREKILPKNTFTKNKSAKKASNKPLEPSVLSYCNWIACILFCLGINLGWTTSVREKDQRARARASEDTTSTNFKWIIKRGITNTNGKSNSSSGGIRFHHKTVATIAAQTHSTP